ncbi:MAG: putative rRNA maturation factor [Sulfurimonas sp.]|jgi:probable rRNA maturation factor|uniref:rRNA maturation RNase YbeY n=1 Tax=Sulfurimonas sp. TaxID=2022749 RepID=UPI0039E22D4F
MIELDNRTSFEVNKTLLSKIANSYTNKEIELIITNNDEIQSINKEHRDIDTPTDVLSFPYADMPMSPLGSIIISLDYIQEKAKELGHSENDECALLFIHGLLHLLGFDHEVDNGEMREEEQKTINMLNLPKSLIIRTQG